MQYKGKEIVTTPKGIKYLPITVTTANDSQDMAVTDIETLGGSIYCKLGDDTYLWKLVKNNAIKLTDSRYKAVDLGYSLSISQIPEELDSSELTTTSGMFFCNVEAVKDRFASLSSLNDGNGPTADDMQEMASRLDPDNPLSSATPVTDSDDNIVIAEAYTSLIEAPVLNIENVTDMSNMFGYSIVRFCKDDPDDIFSSKTKFTWQKGCKNLTTVPEYNMSKAENVHDMFAGCTSLPKVFPWQIDFRNIMAKCKENTSDTDGAPKFIEPFKCMFEGSSVEEITVIMNSFEDDKYRYFDEDTGKYSNNQTLTPENLDSTGTLKKITVVVPGIDSSSLSDEYYNTWVVRTRKVS